MKKLKMRSITFLLAFALLAALLPTMAAASEVIASGTCGTSGSTIIWELNSDGVLELKGSGEMKNFSNGLKMPWYKYRDNIKVINLSDGLTSIGDYAFYGCSNLALTELPNGLTSIGDYAFYGCSNLALTKLPDGITSIGEYTFYCCTSLALRELPSGLTSIAGGTFCGCSSLALTELPSGITSIGGLAFSGCSSLVLTKLPSGITSIEDGTFNYCSSLALTELPSGITSIANNAFGVCGSLALTELPNGLTSIGVSAFSGCASLALTELPSGLTSIGVNAFLGCESLALTELPSGITSIPYAAFQGCISLALKELPGGITNIADKAFQGCSSLALTSLPDGLTSIGEGAFYECTNLALTELPSELTSIGDVAFAKCTSLALKELPEGTTQIGIDAFKNATWAVATEHYVPNGNGGYRLNDTTYSLVKTGSIANADIANFTDRGLIPSKNPNELIRQQLPSDYIHHGQAIVLRRYYDLETITITIKDGKGGSTTQEVPYGGKATEPELEEKPGYKVTWVTENGEHFDFDTPITEPITIHPVWAPVGAIHGTVVDNQEKPVPDAHIAIVAGNTNYLETDADANGHFWIYDVPYGSYDMVTSKRALTVTALFELDHTLEEVTVTLPDAQTNSILDVNQGTKDVVVGGLDTLFNSEIYNEADKETVANGGSVTVKMMVKAVNEEDIPDSAQELNAAAAADGKTIFGYMEMDVAKITETVAGENIEENIPELPQLLQIIDPLSEEQKGKTGYVVYRMHEGTVYPITETPNVNGAYITVSDDTLTIYASKFSAYCLAFDDPSVKPAPGPSPIVMPDDDDDDDGRRNPFIDVKPDDWFYKDVLDAYHAGYMEGVTSNTFKPNAPLTRAQAAYTFARVAKAELKELEITSDFEDVTSRTTYANAITWANATGVEIGYGNGNFGPTDSLTREQLALMLYRTYGDETEPLAWEGDFADVDDVSDWAEEAVRWAVHVGLLEGTDGGKLLPQGTVTRAEAAVLILRTVKSFQ